MPNDQAEIVAELYKRRSTLDPEKVAIVDELAKRLNITTQAAPAQPKSAVGRIVDNIVAFGRGAGSQLNPVTMLQGAAEMVAHPIDTGRAMAQAQADVGGRAADSFKRGDYVEGVRHAINFFIPFLGPQIDAIADKTQAAQSPEQFSEAMGEAAGVGIANALPGSPAGKALLSKARVPVVPAMKATSTAVERAVDFARKRGIPVSAATATGNKFVQGTQALADISPVGSIVAKRAKAAEDAAISRVFGELADEVHPQLEPTQAGADVRSAVQGVVEDRHGDANLAYGALRNIENDPANLWSVQTGTKTVDTGVVDAAGKPVLRQVPVTESMPLPVDVRAAKQALKPVYAQMMRQLPVSQQRASAGLKAIENIVNGPDFAPLSQVDLDLGTIKGIARGADLPELRNMSQGLGAHAVQKLEDAVQDTVRRAGPDAERALAEGRAATVAKYEAADVLRRLREEPRQAFDQLIYKKDSGVEFLKKAAKQAPAEMPKIGRALLEDLVGQGGAEGMSGKATSIHSRWESIGPETKKVLFQNPKLIEDLDNFFLYAKKAAEEVNPSKSAVVGSLVWGGGYALTNPGTGIPMIIGSGALAKLLHSPKAVDALTRGLTVRAGAGAEAAIAAARILKIAGDAAGPAAAERPAAAGTPTTTDPQRKTSAQR